MVQQQIARLQSMPKLERHKKMMNKETYFKERVSKLEEKSEKCQKRNKEVEMAHLMDYINQDKGLDELNLVELHGLTWLVQEKIKETIKWIEYLQQVLFAPSTLHRGLALSPQGPIVDEMTRIGSGSDRGVTLRGDGRTSTESLLSDQCFIDMMKNNEHKYVGINSIHMGLPYHLFAGSSRNDNVKLPRHSFGGYSSVPSNMDISHRNFRGPSTNMGLPPLSLRPHATGASIIGLPNGSSVGGNRFGLLENDMMLVLHPYGENIASSSVNSEFEMQLFRLSGGSNNGANSDTGLPFDGKTSPDDFTPCI